ncbi:MAG TPA: hypothetical protein VGC87_08910 [Pyrinomonadaceae bacterium]|jgi:hypothetical protein
MKYQTLSRYLRAFGRNGFTRRARQLALALALGLLLPVAAAAYTVVLRGGRRVEIPATFTVTKLTLTYEAAPGINVTLQMATIDIPATERANNESAGALLRRVGQRPTVAAGGAATLAQSKTARRELTSQDIERARAARARSEQDYERRRVELGLPSLEETRRRTAEETQRLAEISRQVQAEETQAESYWRARSSELRTEMAALDAQINYVRARLAETPDYLASLGSYAFVTSAGTFPQSHFLVARFPVVTGNPGFMRGVNPGVPQAGFLAFGGIAAQGHVPVNPGLLHRPIGPGFPRGGFGRRGFSRRGIGVPGAALVGTPYNDYDYYGERANLDARLHELEAARAGFQARWRLLEEDARRAGAPPGWLRQ